MIDYDVGDVVVCVDASPCRYAPYKGKPYTIKAGEALRVVGMNGSPSGKIGVHFTDRHTDNPWGFEATRFRKLPKATDEFAEQMRRLKPKAKPRVDA